MELLAALVVIFYRVLSPLAPFLLPALGLLSLVRGVRLRKRGAEGARKWFVAAAIFLLVGLGVCVARAPGPYHPLPPSFSGNTTELAHTQVVPTLDTPMEEGKNVIWCASFPIAWKKLQNGLAKGPVKVDGADEVCARLNAAPDPAPDVPQGACYATAGWVDKGIIDTIHKAMAAQFPDAPPPEFPGIAENSFLTYSYLHTAMKFPIPYFDAREPLAFTDSAGQTADIRSFGVREEDEYAYKRLRGQPLVLLRDEEHPPNTFALDLCRDSEEVQIVAACMEPKETLAATLTLLEERMAAEPVTWGQHLDPLDTLLVPDIVFNLTHHFSELENRVIGNPALKGQRMDCVQQDIAFRLDRSGVELWSQTKIYCRPAPIHYHFDRPFLVYLKKRGTERPFFVMWVDNAELLQPWELRGE